MEELFTKTEYEQLLKNASWSDESDPSGDCLWMNELKKLSQVFQDSAYCPDRYSAAADDEISRIFFSFFLTYIDVSAEKICTGTKAGRDRLFLPDALAEFKSGCLRFCTDHWSSVCASALRNAGYSPFRAASDSNVLQYISSGKCFRDCCLSYPMFARFFAEYMISVRNELSALISVLNTHRITVYTRLCDPRADEEAVPPIACLGAAESDRHSGGRTVHIITFADGQKVVYKPHSSRMDIAFSAWLDYLTGISGEKPFERADSIDFGSCSFYRFIFPRPFFSKEETARFFYREGFLLGAVFSLCGHDLHSENIIAASDPVIVDSETLVEIPDPDFSAAYGIMSTTMLPLCSCHPGYHKEPCGACDTGSGSSNLPLLNGKPCGAQEFPEEMISGFLASMNAVLGSNTALATIRYLFTGVSTRKLILPSYSYEYTLLALNTPRRLGSARDTEHAMNILLERQAEKSSEALQRKARIRLEREAMRKLDIPILHVELDAEAIDRICSRLTAMNAEDLQRQVKYMRFLLDRGSSLRRSRAPETSGPAGDKLLHGLAKETLQSFGSVYHVAVPREDGEPRFALGGTAFLEGNLGAAVALAGYLICFEESSDSLCEAIRRKLQDYLSSLARRKDSRVAFSILEPGLAEGMGGMLAGAFLLFRSGLIGQDLFVTAADGILSSTQQALDSGRVFSLSHSFLYGFNGLKYALDRVCTLGGMPAELANRAEKISLQLGREIFYPEKAAKDMLHAELDEAYSRFDSSLIVRELSLPFPGLFFGTAGKLFRFCAERSRTVSPERDFFFEFFE